MREHPSSRMQRQGEAPVRGDTGQLATGGGREWNAEDWPGPGDGGGRVLLPATRCHAGAAAMYSLG